ncbi:hypothetical protein GCM10018952_37960 [Streptosporangium vulgare]
MQEETARSAIDTFISAFNASDDSYVTALLSPGPNLGRGLLGTVGPQ